MSNVNTARLANSTKIVWIGGNQNPFKVNGPRFKRIQTVRKNSGKTVAQFRAMKGLKRTTLRFALNCGLVKAVA
jgi:hypothetical protein